MNISSKNWLLNVLIWSLLVFVNTRCGSNHEEPDSELSDPTIFLSESQIGGPANAQTSIEVEWRAPRGVESISVDSNVAELPSTFSGTRGNFTSLFTLPTNETLVTFTIMDIDQRQNTTTILVLPDIDDVGAQLEFPVKFRTISFEDDNLVPDVEPEPHSYDFADAICSNALDTQEYDPAAFQNYVRDYYAMRTLRDCTDLHQGIDIVHEVDCEGERYDDNNPPMVHSICAGVVTRIDEENLCSVYVTCDQGYANSSMGDNIETVYRHLDSFAEGLIEGEQINQGDVIGVMGVCEANLRHLHLSAVRTNPHKNINGARLFDPDRGGILKRLGSGASDIRVVHCTTDTTIIRFAFPGNEWGLVQLGVTTEKLGTVVYNSEYVSLNSNSTEERDDPYFIDGIGLFAYPFNGENSACDLYNRQKADLCSEMPGSTKRGENNFYPIDCEDAYTKVVAVYDIALLNFGCDDLQNEISGETFIPYAQDIWGHGIKTAGIDL